jgi:hypothetical protein
MTPQTNYATKGSILIKTSTHVPSSSTITKTKEKTNDKTPYPWQVSMHSQKNGKFVKHNNAMQKYVKIKSSKIVELFQFSMVIDQIIP